MFYHSHIINGVTITHSHIHWRHHDANGLPVEHSHTKNELVLIQLINHIIIVAALGIIPILMILILLNQYLIPVIEIVFLS
ncbi:MAG: hypothetical protein J7L96_09615, partial [Bacteroidales bacterium]|nr:hypothetical protein [Bacteroidales bacterium]